MRQKIEELYVDINSNWQTVSKQASDILYGALGSTKDARDWDEIMFSQDIVSAASDQTTKLHEPYIDIQSKYERVELTYGTITKVMNAQFLVLKNKYNKVLITSPTTKSSNIIDQLNQFGRKQINLDKSIFDKIEIRNLDFEN